MIVYTPAKQRTLSLFRTPFQVALNPDNRWVKMVDIVPWDNMAKVFFSKLSQNLGRPTVDLRIVLGALMISHVENLSDERTIEFIQENIYAQYFVGLSSFQADAVFTPSLFVEIRKRLGTQGSAHLNELLITEAAKLKMIKHRRSVDDGYDKAKPIEGVNAVENDSASLPVQVTDNEDVESVSAGVGESKTQADTPNPGERNRGQMVIDATVAPVQMAYPTDTNLLADCRRHSEQLLDLIYEAHKANWKTKPRTYRREAQRKSTNFSKKRSKGKKDIRKAVKNELGYLKSNHPANPILPPPISRLSFAPTKVFFPCATIPTLSVNF